MTDSTLLFESFMLMLIGMGIVFSFLLLLVGILRLMSALILRLAPAEELQPVASSTTAPLPTDTSEDLIAVISAAIARYRAPR
ncbi:OadG family protein [Allochromatium palmeri]|uniref:Probable oxaloacetate decarboxylase gamma chain n=1 Tax=Allochromatium palmeri TaxID=231048 RepID=A0A6N8EHL5_9GAMM|nr:OadG family protein [Allochromatium palmeri]MTW22389.1 sodium pump decarboxylase subunit gamma [Allochromatium palmeri]